MKNIFIPFGYVENKREKQRTQMDPSPWKVMVRRQTLES